MGTIGYVHEAIVRLKICLELLLAPILVLKPYYANKSNYCPLYVLDDTGICMYRLPQYLRRRFESNLRRPTLRSLPLPVPLQVMVALTMRFYATGSVYAVTAYVYYLS